MHNAVPHNVRLDKHVSDVLVTEALTMGVTPEERIRFLVTQHVLSTHILVPRSAVPVEHWDSGDEENDL